MKKYIIFLVLIIALLGIISYSYIQLKISKNNAILNNKEYTQMYQKTINGNDLATLINRTIDKNNQNDVKTNDKEIFIDNGTNSIQIELKFKDNEKNYSMESIYKNDISKFIKLYSLENFKCTKIEYHSKTKLIKYLYFEQV